MKPNDYEKKVVDTSNRETKVDDAKDTVFVSPKGNQYNIPASRVKDFKEKLKVDETWEIK